MSNSPEVSIDYERLMQANLARVFGERDAKPRIAAIRELYAEDAVLYEPDASATAMPPSIRRWMRSCRACRQTSSSRRLAPPLATTVSDGCAGNPGHLTVPQP
jgi:hypothetical protein